MEFNKKYNASSIQHEISTLREQEKFPGKGDKGSMLTSLPFPTATPLHLGHAENLILQDVFSKYQHMIGKGTTLHPLRYYGSFLTNEKIQQQLAKIGTSKEKISKAQLFSIIENKVKKQKFHNSDQLKKLGLSLDSADEHVTFSIRFSRFLRKLFCELVQDDTIYEAEDIVYWNTKFQTSLGKDEVRFEKQKGKKYTIKYFISTKNNSVNVCSLFPETIFGDVALAVHPDNKRYSALVGQKAIIPIINKTVPIIADPRVDLFANNGIMRITPAHDLPSLQIAKDHKLPLDHFAIDQDGCFTKFSGDFSGKKVDEFMENIIQNLDDIDNIVNVENCEYDVPICKKTGEKLQTMCLVQWFLRMTKAKEMLNKILEAGKIKAFPATSLQILAQQMESVNNRCISKNYLFGQGLPIWISDEKGLVYILDDVDVLEAYKKNKKKQKSKIFLSLIIFNLIADGRLNSTFEMDELIHLLLANDLSSHVTILESYTQIIQDDIGLYTPQIKELKEILRSTDKSKSDNLENFAAFFIKLLENSFAVEHVANHKYKFLINALIPRDSGLKQEKRKFDISFVNAVESLYSLGIFDEKKAKTKIKAAVMTVGDNLLLDVCKILLLSLQLKEVVPFDTLFINKTVTDHKGKKMGMLCENTVDIAEIIKEFGADVARLYLMAEGTDPLLFEHQRLDFYNDLVHKFWNACRWVSINTQESDKKKKVNLNTLEKEIAKDTSRLHDFDLRIINTIKNLYQDIDLYITGNNANEFCTKLLHIIKNDFCEKYLEISKNNSSELTDKVMLLVIGKILKLLRPYAPFVSEKIRILMGFQGYLHQQTLEGDFLEKISKNYKIQLFMDIIDKFLILKEQLGCKKHTPVDAFIKANPDFLKFTKSHETTIKKIITINRVDYIHSNEINLHGYSTQDIIDMTIGVKATTATLLVEKPRGLPEVKKEIEQMKEYMQSLKNTVSALMTNGNDESQVTQKKKEINKIKKDILELEYEAGKLKSK